MMREKKGKEKRKEVGRVTGVGAGEKRCQVRRAHGPRKCARREEMRKVRKEESIYPAVKERKQGEWRRNEANTDWMGKGNEGREQREEGAKCRTDRNIGQSRRK